MNVPNELLVKFKPRASYREMEATLRKVRGRRIQRSRNLGIDRIHVRCNIVSAWKILFSHKAVAFVEPNWILRTGFVPNDPLFPTQYGMRQIRAPRAWNVTQGRMAVAVAIVDTGVQWDHPDLAAKILPGFNFVANDINTNDDNGHGTHVAGIAAAITNNRQGVAGTAPKVGILPVKVLNQNGVGTLFDVARGIVFAANMGARVINLSLGGPVRTNTLRDAVNHAWQEGAVVVAAAGNNGTNLRQYPAAFRRAITVAATNASDRRASFSNFGKWVDVAAPGVRIMSTYIGSRYVRLSGTSMAAPHVSGLAALLAGQRRNNVRIRRVIQRFANRIPGTGTFWTFGRINANRSVRSRRSK
ncbi:S8 family peptidase [Desmospora profundinema]|uniref:Thermitase n=1 Tax=Desmospora profundinema TaxID=1571184 RepID=A0ABU1IH14_9BACL|nr:S8 family peptidase [Desmospora profundinema]MDR6224067.1 thermitase [Desmospora profundinema]